MNETPKDDALEHRVLREKLAHNDDDVLAKSLRLKKLFRHVLASPTVRRFERDFASYTKALDGKQVLDLGCGTGEQAVDLLRAGATVHGIDISDRYVSVARKAAKEAGFSSKSYSFNVMDAHQMDFDTDTFDLVLGRGILHHLDLQVALAEIKRVLKPGGVGIFHEPLADNPILRLLRVLTPSARTSDEKPVTGADLRLINESWKAECRYYGLLGAPAAAITSIILRPFDDNFLLHLADWLEVRLNRQWASLLPMNQYVLMRLEKPSPSANL